MGITDLTPYSPRLLLQWDDEAASARHRTIDGTLVFADVSGFTRLSERLARTRGKAGAEELTTIISGLFGDLLTVAASRGGEMLKFGGDAVLLFFRGEGHPARAAAAAWDMQRRLDQIGRIETDRGPVRLRMSVGINSGPVDLFKVGRSHEELIVAGPVTTGTVQMEAAADARQVLLSATTASLLPPGCLGVEVAGGRLLRRPPVADVVPIVAAVFAGDASRFVPVGLRDHLASGDVDPDHRIATVAFIHALGMDTLLEDLGGSVVAERLHETLCVVQDACAELDVSFLATDLAADGTKVMAAAGAPAVGDDDEGRMLLALRRMVTAGTPLPLRAGAMRGHVFAAAVGPPYRKTFTTMGDVTNTAARVMGHARPGEVLVLADVLDATKVRFGFEQREPFSAKGKSELLVPHLVLEPSSETREPATTRLPLRGRDRELAELLRLAETARGGAGSAVEVVGDMGAGKSRLLDELRAEARELLAMTVHCESYHRATPFHAARLLLDALLPPGEDRADVLRTTVQNRASSLLAWLPLLAGVLDLDAAETDETRLLDSQFRLSKTASVTAELVHTLLTEPAILIVEDVHWLDHASAAVLRELERQAPTSPWLLVATRRNETATFVPSASGSSIQLGALPDDEMVALVEVATADAPIPRHRRDEIIGRAAGNPLCLTVLLDSLQANGDGLPESLERVMAAQIDRLPPAERRLVRLAAVLGSRFDLELLAELSGDATLASVGTRAMTARLQWLCIPDGRGRMRFRHQLVRDVAYESLPYRQRRDLHALAGAVIERGSALDEHAGILSLHFLHAGVHEKCWEYARVAAARAAERWANVEAVTLLERALSAAGRVPELSNREVAEAWHQLGIRRALLGVLDGAGDAFRRASRLGRDDPTFLAWVCLRQARLAERQGRTDRTVHALRRGLRHVRDLETAEASAVRAELLVFLAWTKEAVGRPRQAVKWAQLGLEEGRRSSNQRAIAYAYTVLNGAEIALGRQPDPELAKRALAIYEELCAVGEQAIVLNNLGTDAYCQGRWREARALYERSRTCSERGGNDVDAGYGSMNVAEILVDQGLLEEASALLDRVDALFRSVDHRVGLAFVASHRGRIQAHLGDADAAVGDFLDARLVFEENQLTPYVLEADARIAECHARLGRLDGATSTAHEALERDRALGGTRVAALLLRVLAYASAARGELTAAADLLEQSRAIAVAMASPYDEAVALDGLLAVADAGGPPAPSGAADERDRLLGDLGVVSLPPRAIRSTATAPA